MDSEVLADYLHTQADLNLFWVHMDVVGFVVLWLIIFNEHLNGSILGPKSVIIKLFGPNNQ